MADQFDFKPDSEQNVSAAPARHRRVDRHKQLYQQIQQEVARRYEAWEQAEAELGKEE